MAKGLPDLCSHALLFLGFPLWCAVGRDAIGWYRSQTGQSCTDVCTANSRSCDPTQPATVTSEQKFSSSQLSMVQLRKSMGQASNAYMPVAVAVH